MALIDYYLVEVLRDYLLEHWHPNLEDPADDSLWYLRHKDEPEGNIPFRSELLSLPYYRVIKQFTWDDSRIIIRFRSRQMKLLNQFLHPLGFFAEESNYSAKEAELRNWENSEKTIDAVTKP